jgi:DNA-binding CsgD family transcriptional regulator
MTLEDEAGTEALLTVGEVARLASETLEAIAFPALVLEVPSERIVASSPAATLLVDPEGGMVVGHLLEEFTVDRAESGADRFAGGLLNGFETFRTLRRQIGEDAKVRMWIRPFSGLPSSQFVVVVIVADDPAADGMPRTDWREAPAVVGMVDATLMIERISSDAEELFKLDVDRLLGVSLLSLVAEGDVASCLAALSEASATQSGITLHLDIRTAIEGPAMRCEVWLLPLQPTPSCAFVFLPIPEGGDIAQLPGNLSAMLMRLGSGAEVAQVARGVLRGTNQADVPGLKRLTTRELEIVSRLLEGDRTPAIALELFLSQSTVRTHLASVFTKLGVSSQQELLNMFRAR